MSVKLHRNGIVRMASEKKYENSKKEREGMEGGRAERGVFLCIACALGYEKWGSGTVLSKLTYREFAFDESVELFFTKA